MIEDTLSSQDKTRIKETYSQNPINGTDPDSFLNKILGRISVEEWYVHKMAGTHRTNPRGLLAEPSLRRFLNQETHYELERRGYTWKPLEQIYGCFENLTSVQYQEARYRVIDAFVARAIAFFRTGGLHNRTENLRTSLQPYLQ
jgi:hypothetical protein